jgi:hypothetical protein
MLFAWQAPANRHPVRIDHDVGTTGMGAVIFYGLLATWGLSLALMAYLMRPRHRDAD